MEERARARCLQCRRRGPSGRRLPREGRDVTCRSAPSTCPSRLPLCHTDAQQFARAATLALCSDARTAVFRRGPRTRRVGHLPSARGRRAPPHPSTVLFNKLRN